MKKWQIIFLNQDGEQRTLPCDSDLRPTPEHAAQLIRAHLFPVIDKVDLHDLQDRTTNPTAKGLKEYNAVEIIGIRELA